MAACSTAKICQQPCSADQWKQMCSQPCCQLYMCSTHLPWSRSLATVTAACSQVDRGLDAAIVWRSSVETKQKCFVWVRGQQAHVCIADTCWFDQSPRCTVQRPARRHCRVKKRVTKGHDHETRIHTSPKHAPHCSMAGTTCVQCHGGLPAGPTSRCTAWHGAQVTQDTVTATSYQQACPGNRGSM